MKHTKKIMTVLGISLSTFSFSAYSQQSPFDSLPQVENNNQNSRENMSSYVTMEDFDMMMNDLRAELQFIVTERVENLNSNDMIASEDGVVNEKRITINGKDIIKTNSNYITR